jgi:iron complex outermembrane receptor protein
MFRRSRLSTALWLGLLAVPTAYAQPDPIADESAAAADEATDEDAEELEKITVTASRIPRALSDLATSVSQIEEPELAEQLTVSTNILETLDVLVPGLTVSQEEARLGCRTNIRGRPAQFLINGVPTNDNLRRSSCGSLYGISPFAIERIEVLRGATALFGAGAPGGAINLITRQGRTAEVTVDAITQVSINPHETSGTAESNVYVGASQDQGGFDYYVGLGAQDYGVRRNPDDGIVPGEEFRSWSLNTSLGWQVGDTGELRFTGLYYIRNPDEVYGTDFTQISGERLAGSAFIATPPNPFAHQAETEQTVLTLGYTAHDVFGHTLDVSAYWHEETLIQRATDFFGGDVFYFDSDAENERRGLRTTLNRATTLGAGELDLTYGIDALRQRYYRPQVDPADDRRVIGYVAPEVLLESVAAFVQPQFRSGPWLFTGGVRYERFDGEVGSEGFDPTVPRAATPGETPDFSLTLWNAGIVYDVTAAVQLFGGFSQGAEISEFGRAARGARNPALINLDAAKSDQYELGVRGQYGALDFSVAAFHSESDKAASLQADPTCAGQPLCPLIPLRLEQEIDGLEVTADWSISERTRVGALLTLQDGEFNAPGATPIPFGTDTLSPPRSTAYVEFEPASGWHNRLQATYYDSTDEYDAAQIEDGFRNSESVFLVDFTTSYPVGPGVVSLGVANLFNEEYVNVTNQTSGDFFYYLSEGTRVTLGYALKF